MMINRLWESMAQQTTRVKSWLGLGLAVLFAAGLCPVGFGTAVAGTDSYAEPGSTGTALSDSTADGPHVLWLSDSVAVVFYLCHDSMIQRRLAVDHTLRFDGLCYDTDVNYVVPAALQSPGPEIVSGASRIFAVSDIHGEFSSFTEILSAGGVIDDRGTWDWGDGQLVINGDVFDRGDQVTECLWLIYRLEHQARAAGGAVHLLLGNHELMPLRGDLRYVNPKYLEGICRATRIRYYDLFGPDMELGRWLRTKHTAMVINDVLFVHGGLSAEFTEHDMPLNELNNSVREYFDIPSSRLAFTDLPRYLFGSLGPFWYRGYHYEMEGKYPQASEADITEILAYFDASAVVVGHTGVDSVAGFFDDRVFAIDVPLEDLGTFQALLIENGRFYRVAGDGRRTELR
jgi:hypothetical protein